MKEKMTKPLFYFVGAGGIVVEGTDGGNVDVLFYEDACMALEAGVPAAAGIRVPSGGPHTDKAYIGTYMSLVKRRAISLGLFERHQSSQPAHGGVGAYRGNRDHLRHLFFAKAEG
jgi:hypothetical protein